MMQAKAAAIACFDTHAGSALYDLEDARARQTGEADLGARRLWQQRTGLASSDWQPMLELLARLNRATGPLQVYPGSPAWMAEQARPGDAVTAFELHPGEGERLENWAAAAGTRVLRQDGLRGLVRQLPPRQPRLLVLVDPSYEVKTEYRQVADTLARAWKICRHGVYLVWYPLLTSGRQQGLLEALLQGPVRKVLRSELRLCHAPARGMAGSGMLVVNPPWQFDQRFSAMLEDLRGPEQSWLVPEVPDWLIPE